MPCQNLQTYKVDLEKAEELEIKLPIYVGSQKKQGEKQTNKQTTTTTKKTTSVSLTRVKTFDCIDYSKLWKIPKEMGIPDHLICLLRNLYAGQEATELDLEQ